MSSSSTTSVIYKGVQYWWCCCSIMYYGKDKNLDIVSFFFHQACCLNQFQKSFVVLIWFAFVVPYFFQLRNNLKIQNVAKVKPDPSIFFSDSSNNPGKESLTFMYTCFVGSINHQHNNKALSMSFYSKTQCHFVQKGKVDLCLW